MKNLFQNRAVGFWLDLAGTVLTLVGIILYALYQIAWYVVAFVLITIVCSFLMGIYVPLCKQFFPPALYNVLITVINGGVQMVIYFPIYKIIFPEGEQKKN